MIGQHKQHDGVFRGVFLPFESLSDPSRRIQIDFAGWPNYGSLPDIPNLKERPWTRFETVPSQVQGSLVIRHDLSLDRMFQNSRDLQLGDIKPGEKSRVRLNPKRLGFISWWTFGDLNGNFKFEGKIFCEMAASGQDRVAGRFDARRERA